MIYNYLKVIIRNFISDKMYSLIIIFGLAVGTVATLVIAQYIHFELSFDKQYPGREGIYYSYIRGENEQAVGDWICHPAVAPLCKRSIPEVMAAVRIAPVLLVKGAESVLRREENGKTLFYSREDKLYMADPEVLDFFSIPMLAGDSKHALAGPNSIVLTKRLAQKIFGKHDPLDEVLRIQDETRIRDLRITGIIENPARNSSLQYNAFVSLDRKDLEEVWTFPIFKTFIKLYPGSDPEVVEKKINEAAREPLRSLEVEYELKESIHLYPFSEFHFYEPYNSTGINTVKFTGDKTLIAYFAILAILILTISWANYINLTTARAIRRAKEVGLRKVNGAGRKNLVFQFLMEFLFLNVISMFLAFTIAQLLFPQFARIIGSSAEWIFWSEPWFWVAILGFVIFSTLVSGIYPAFIMSNFNPSTVLKGNFSTSQRGLALRKGLVLGQLGLSVFLSMSIYVIARQLVYLQNKNLGMTVDQVLAISTNELDTGLHRTKAFQLWTAKVENLKYVINTTAVARVPGHRGGAQWFYLSTDPDKSQSGFATNIVSENYFSTLDMEILYGRDFSQNQIEDTDKVIINEKAALEFGFKKPASAIGQEVTLRRFEKKYKIIGVVKNFNSSLKRPVWGHVFFRQQWNPRTKQDFNHYLVKLSSANLSASMADLEKEWKALFADAPFDYFFLDTYFDNFYREEQQFAGVFGVFSVIGVVITCMGLFAISLYNAGCRTKEIGIRKSLGASATGIMWLFSKEYVRLILISSLVVTPISLWLLDSWLKNYPNRITLQADVVILPLCLLLGIAMLTVGYHTYKTAHMDPVKSLRND